MDKLFAVAKEITNPYSLAALFLIILFILYKAIVSKVEVQKGIKGYRIIRKLMNLVALIAIVTLFLVFGLKGYEVYSKVDEFQNQDSLKTSIGKMNGAMENHIKKQVEQSSDSLKSKINKRIEDEGRGIIDELELPELTVEYYLLKYAGADLTIGNNGDKIILLKNLTIHWKHEPCPSLTEPLEGVCLVKYRYSITISPGSGSAKIDSSVFKYGKGDVDQFNIDIRYSDSGIYTVWFTFDYKILGGTNWNHYETSTCIRKNCEKLGDF